VATNPEEAVEFLRIANDAESQNRNRGLTALKFRFGDQWPQYAVSSRGLDRPQLTMNETNTLIKRVTNAQRQQRPRGKAQPVDNFADKKTAKVITGLLRHIEVNSDADHAYDTAFDFGATIGWGYWRLRMDYISDKSDKQDIYIDAVDNPFCVYFDPNSKAPDGSDAERALITDLMTIEGFKKEYPDAQVSNFEDRGTGDSDPDWVTEHDIRLAEYFYTDKKKEKLVRLSDGSLWWPDELPSAIILKSAGLSIAGDARMSVRRQVKWCKQTCSEILEERDIAGRWVPIVPFYWTNVMIDNERRRQGLVEDAMDPARMNNFWQTAMTEYLALSPKAKWIMAEGQDEGHEKEWASANRDPTPVLRYKPTDVEGRPAEPPKRIAPDPPPQGMIEASFMARQNLSAVMGVFDPAVRGGAQHKSDKTLNAERGQSENTNFDGYDNLTRSMKHTYRIALGWFPTVYDTERVQRIIGVDGREDLVTLNEKVQTQDETGAAIHRVLNDMTVGDYDVVMETGPGYDTLRQEATAVEMELLGTPLGEKIAQTADDLVVRGMDFMGSDEIADRLAAANPLAQIDEKSDIPPKVQMQMKGLQQMVQQLQGQLQAAGVEIKFGLQKEQMKQEGETRRKLMEETGDAHEREITASQKRHDTETFSQTSLNVAEINGMVKLLTSHTEHGHRMRELLAELEHSSEQQDRELTAKSEQQEPVGQTE
jgi:hypothetical protein